MILNFYRFAKCQKFVSLALVGIGLMAATSDLALAGASGSWKRTGNLNTDRYGGAETLLQNGQVLVTGGTNYDWVEYASAELYNPFTGKWTFTGSMNEARTYHTATLLQNGQVLVAGGDANGASAELYDPASGLWTITGSMNFARYSHTAILLQDGQVLVVGGGSNEAGATAPAELYNPSTGIWTTTGSLNVPRYNVSTMALLHTGQALIAGGYQLNTWAPLASTELYDPSSGKWTVTGSMNDTRALFRPVVLSSGEVLAAGGNDGKGPGGYTSSAELYNPSTGKWTATGSMVLTRDLASATLLRNGEVLVAGGENYTNGPLSEAELYNPSTGKWAKTGSMTVTRIGPTAALLGSGQVLVVGGDSGGNTTELYTP